MSFFMKGTRPVSLAGKYVFRLSDETFTFCVNTTPGLTSKELDKIRDGIIFSESMNQDAHAKPAVPGGEANHTHPEKSKEV